MYTIIPRLEGATLSTSTDVVTPVMQRLGVDAIMESVRWEQVGRFTNDAFRDLCTSMVRSAI